MSTINQTPFVRGKDVAQVYVDTKDANGKVIQSAWTNSISKSALCAGMILNI